MAKNEIYISRKRQQVEKFYYKRAYNLIFSQNFKEIFICGLGSCVNLAVKVALFILEALPNSSTNLVDISAKAFLGGHTIDILLVPSLKLINFIIYY